ncbi:MAG: type IV pilus biogenesis protein PilM [Vicinamibacterales bacterium]
MSQSTASIGSWLASPPPAVALEITATSVLGVALAEQRGSRNVAAHANQGLTEGVVVPALNAPNIHDEGALAGAIGDVLDRLGQRARRVALVLPDSVAKVSIVRFEKVPAKAQDLEQLIRWQVRKSAPFRIEDAQVAWQPALALAGGGREYLVTVARRDIIRGYEQACDAAGAHAGLVDITSFNQVNAVLAGAAVAGDWLLINVAVDYATLALVRAGDIIFFRNRTAAAGGDLADLVHQTAMYHEDRLGGGGFTRIVLAGISVMGAEEAERLRRMLSDRVGATVELIDFRSAAEMRDRIAVGPDLLDQLAPAVGILLRERSSRRASEVA